MKEVNRTFGLNNDCFTQKNFKIKNIFTNC